MRNTSGLKHGGSPGRPKGVPNRASVEAKTVCAALVDDPEYQQALAARLRAGTLAPAVECMIWHYGKGKPREQVEQSGELVITWKDDIEARLVAARARVSAEALPPTHDDTD